MLTSGKRKVLSQAAFLPTHTVLVVKLGKFSLTKPCLWFNLCRFFGDISRFGSMWCGKSVAVSGAVLILIISYSIWGPRSSTTDWETDRQAGMRTRTHTHRAGWIIRGGGQAGGTLNSIVWKMTKSQSDNQLPSLWLSIWKTWCIFWFDDDEILPACCTLVKKN